MSILIKGMEMPHDKNLAFVITPKGDVYMMGNTLEEHGHLATAKAAHVPSHGDLIDRDAYEKLLRGLGSRDYRREKGTICDAIKFLHPHYAPTIIPAEEGET